MRLVLAAVLTTPVRASTSRWREIAIVDAVVLSVEQDAERVVRHGFWKKIGRAAGRIPFAEDAVAAYFCAFDPDTPFRVRATLVGALAYFIMPADVMPDFLPLLGFADDASVIAAALAGVASHLGEKHRLAARQALGRLPLPGQALAAPDNAS